MMMNKILALSILSFSLSGCITPAYEKSRDLESAKTLQEKRDVLLKWSPNGLNPLCSNLPTNAREARNRYLKYNDESNEFLNGLINKCYSSISDACVFNYYWSAAKLEEGKEDKKYEDMRNEFISKNNLERKLKIKVKPGDSFKCKLSITTKGFDEVKDSGIRVLVEDDGDRFSMLTGNNEQIQSPELKEIDDGTGLRVGIAEDNLMTGFAAYDGQFYQIDLKDEVMRRYIYTTSVRISIPYIINDKKSYEKSMTFHAFDCVKLH